MKRKRVFLIVLDSVGAGEAPDAADFGDVGAHTLMRVSTSAALSIPHLRALGLGNIDGLAFLGKTEHPAAAHARLAEVSRGKDTTVGHWEIAGVVSETALPTYPSGFPAWFLTAFARETGRGVLCNRPYSGTDVIRDYGEEQMRTGKWIMYTSADSVCQIAAHEDVIPPEELYEACRIARRLLTGADAVGRVIARPYTGAPGAFVRTANRRDFSAPPPRETLLDALTAAGRDVIAVGKITDIFAGRGITESVLTHGNEEGMRAAEALAERPFEGLCFVNLVDFDMLYGHRNDIEGYARALTAFDAWLPGFLRRLGPEDVLMITADHGCDPGDASTDHTREYIPLLIYGEGIDGRSLGTLTGFGHIAATVSEMLGVRYGTREESLVSRIARREG